MAKPDRTKLGNTLHRVVILGVILSTPMWVFGESIFPQATASEWHRFPEAASAVWLSVWLFAMLKAPKGPLAASAGVLAILFFLSMILLTPL